MRLYLQLNDEMVLKQFTFEHADPSRLEMIIFRGEELYERFLIYEKEKKKKKCTD